MRGQFLARVVFQFSKMATSRHWHTSQPNFRPWRCSNSPKLLFQCAGVLGRLILDFGGVPILKNGDFQALAHFTGQFSALAVFQFAKIAISMCWCTWQADFWIWQCSNSPKWRFQGAGALGRLIFGFGGVPILKNGDLKAHAHLSGQFSA